jgi:Phospholipase A2
MKVSWLCTAFTVLMAVAANKGTLADELKGSPEHFGAPPGETYTALSEGPRYGNYCGFGNYPAPPVDKLDTCCLGHDNCYEHLGLSGNNINIFHPGLGESSDQLGCDAAFCNCLKHCPAASTEWWKEVTELGMVHFFCH